MTGKQQTLGLIAGAGRLPFMVADGARKSGLRVVCAGLYGNAHKSLRQHVDIFYEVPLARPGTWIKRLRSEGAVRTIMAGKVEKHQVFTPGRILKYLPDCKALKIWYWTLRKRDKQNDTILCALADELARGGIILDDSTRYCREHLADAGTMTGREPDSRVKEDIEFGWNIVKRLGEVDIGQAITVKEREVIAVEAIEGTARMIERTGRLCRKGGWTLIKTSKPDQDMRFDVPCIGPETIKSLSQNRGKCIVLEASKTIIIDKPQTLRLAERLGIAIVGHN